MNNRIRQMHLFALSVVMIYAMFVVNLVARKPIVNPIVDLIFIFLTSVEGYRLLVDFLLKLFGNSEILMKLYWGRLFVDGLWSYSYTVDGEDDDAIYFGVWRFEQTLYGTSVVGFGLTDKFKVRSRVRSMTDMINNGNVYEFINIRSDIVDSASNYYSRTGMYFELNKNMVLRYPIRMRGYTVVYGGPLNGRICNNLFIKHESAKTEQDVIDELKRNFKAYGKVHPEGDEIKMAKP